MAPPGSSSGKATRRNSSKTTKKSSNKVKSSLIFTDEENFECVDNPATKKLINGKFEEDSEEKFNKKSSASDQKAPRKKIAQTRGRKPSAKKIFPTMEKQSRRENSKTSRENSPIAGKNPRKLWEKMSSVNSFDSDDSDETKKAQKSYVNLPNCKSSGIWKRRKRGKYSEKLNKPSNFSTSSEDSCDEEDNKISTPLGSASQKSFYKIGNKTRTPRQFYHHHQRRIYRSSDEDEDCCSSTSPQPMGDRLPMIQPNMEPETINMGGEPGIINMGGEPNEDGPSLNVLSPKAPLGLESQQEDEKLTQKIDFKSLDEEEKETLEVNQANNLKDYEQEKLTDSIVSLLEEQSSIIKVSAEFCAAEQQHQHSQQILLRNPTTGIINMREEKQLLRQQQQNLTCALDISSEMIYQPNQQQHYIQQQEHLSIEMAPQLVKGYICFLLNFSYMIYK